MQNVNLTGHFLIAMPNMADPNFAKTLTYMCEHGEHGAMGVIINRPTDLRLHTLLKQIGIQPGPAEDIPVHFGGPVQPDRGFVLHQPWGEWSSTLRIGETMGLTTSKDILEAVGRGEGPQRLLITLGYAGWAPGQLEHEISQNAWLSVSASEAVIFEVAPEARYAAAMHILGVDFATLAEDAGHA